MLERVKTGIQGLDETIYGGFIRNSLILLTGTCGTGKTIMGSQFLYNGAAKYKENGLFVSFEENPKNIKANLSMFEWDIDKFEKKGMLNFLRYDPFHIEDVFELIESNVRTIGAKRIVIDSISALGLYVKDPTELRTMIYNLGNTLRKIGCTALMTSEILPNSDQLSRFGVEEFIADGVIVLYYSRVESIFSRAITIWKMRGTNHSKKIHPYEITKNGIVVYPHEEAFEKIA